jgi:hypothetical protein
MAQEGPENYHDPGKIRLKRLSSQVRELNTLIRKVKRINNYATTEYVDGQLIIDLERSSRGE